MDRKVIALFGAYGSGKTEIALNMASYMSKDRKTVLADLDIVNPYFRSSEKIGKMQEHGVEVIAPVYANTNVDSPMLSPKVGGYFVYKDINYIIDVGGDPVGAKAMGQFRHKFAEAGGKMLFVVNTNRPFTKDVDSVLEMISLVEDGSSMRVDGIIHNTNMSYETTASDLFKAHPIIEDVCKKSGIPLVLVCGSKEGLREYEKTGYKGNTMVLNRFMEIDIW